MTQLRRVLQAVCGAPWAITPEKLSAIAEVIAFRAAGNRLTRSEIRAQFGSPKTTTPSAAKGVAVLPLFGTLAHRMGSLAEFSGGTATERFAGWFRSALADEGTSAIVIDVDSPGGMVQGSEELAREIAGARGAKPIVAIANSMAASAAYWIASAADEIVATPSGLVGSIGVYTVRLDLSELEAKEGIKTAIVSAGKYKAEGHPSEPMDDEELAALQAMVDEYYAVMTRSIAAFRGIGVDAVVNGYGEGRIVTARQALQLGMVDRVASLEAVLGKLANGKYRPKQRAAAQLVEPSLAAIAAAARHAGVAPRLAATLTSQTPLATGVISPSWLAGLADVGAEPFDSSHEPAASEAKEQTMSDQDTAATKEAATVKAATDAHAAEVDRRDRLMAIGAEFEQPMATVRQWIKDKTTPEQALQQIATEQKAAQAAKPAIRVTPKDGGDNGTPHGPFTSLADQLACIVKAGLPGGFIDDRLLKVRGAASGASATVGADGGFLIQKEFATDLLKEAFDEGVLASQCSGTEIGPNADGLEVSYIDETSRVTGSRWGGVQVYRVAEAETVTAKKPKIGKWEVRLEDLLGIAYLTERLIQDAVAMMNVFKDAFTTEMAWKVDDEIYRGTGAGEIQGIKTAGATVSVAKETGQAADTILAENIMKMWSRVRPRSRLRGQWYYNPECEVQLQQMSVKVKNVAGTENVGGFAVFMPPGGLSDSPYGRLYGRPAVPLEYCDALGDKGDIAFLDLSQFKLITKGGVQEAESIHVRFLNLERTLRWWARVNGAPKDKLPLTPYKGAGTLSPFVLLDERA